ncbi:SH3 domain-containing protein [Streptomyces sp. 8N706]|uniref:SH3 domain-containing protein n=1 Tax=Streptomyces sp. 8N706 TaxID=3457416 RepID=UPI003FD00ED2
MRRTIATLIGSTLVAATATVTGASVASAAPQAPACERAFARAAVKVRAIPTTQSQVLGTFGQGAALGCIWKAESGGGKATACGETSRTWLQITAGNGRKGWVFEPCVQH